MQVILLERIEKLGQMGQTVTVKSGYARNYLLPKKKALRATEANTQYFQSQKAQLEAHNLKRRKEAEEVAKKMDNLIVTIIRQASEVGQLYGSVRAQDITDAAQTQGYSFNKSQIILETPIKNLGIHTTKLMLHPEVRVNLKVQVAQSKEEATAQLENEESSEA